MRKLSKQGTSSMSKSIARAIFVLILSMAAVAQTPKVEFFGGDQYTHFGVGNNIGDKNAHGWNIAFQPNFNRVFGIKADFSGAYRQGTFVVTTVPITLTRMSVHQHHHLFGPVFSARTDRATFFGHALFGAA